MPNMAAFTFAYLFTICSLLFIHANAKLAIDPADLKALLIIQRDLGITSQRFSEGGIDLCDASAGVYCERRLSVDRTYRLRVTRLVVDSQGLRGFLSPAIGRLTELKELSLNNNRIGERLPAELGSCRKLEILNLRSNRFFGEVPVELSSLARVRVLDLSSNRFSGNLTFLKYFQSLESLSVADNLFSGKIPLSKSFLRNLRFFDFSGNRFLKGPGPVSSRAEFSASDLPKRYIFAENTTQGGNKSAPASPRGKNATAPGRAPARSKNATASGQAPAPAPGPSAQKHKKKDKSKVAKSAFGFFLGAFAGCISGFVFSLLFKLIVAAIRGGSKDSGNTIFSPLIKKKEDLAFLETEEGLESLEVIGRGGCGIVYKAELPGSNGKLIAVKKIVQPPRDAAELTEEESRHMNKMMRQIRSEIQTVGNIRHRNLLPLLAHVSRPGCHYLVYEFMKNGSLQDILNDVEKGIKEFDWMSRYKVAVGVAAGLEYLHMNQSPRIIHRDLKPGNVLLDDDMEPRIADFGLAKAMPDAQTHITTSNVAGTVGYIAPEYHQTLKFTDKCDIYSFGVLLGVLVIGKVPSHEFFQHTQEMSLVKWMRNVLTSENPSQAIDEKLLGNGYEEQMLLVLKIACFCTVEDPKQRPNSKDVLTMLSQIKR